MDFTKNEAAVIPCLCANPHMNDREISDKLDIKRSTVTLTRNKLVEKGVLKKIYSPNFKSIGFEFLCVFHGDFNPETPYNERKKYLPSQKFNEIFFVATSDLQHVSMACSNVFSKIQKCGEYMEGIYGEQSFFEDKGNEYIHFGLKESTIHRYFDFTPYLSKKLGMEYRSDDIVFVESIKKMRKTEKKIFAEFLKNPTGTDDDISRGCGISRQSVNVIKNDLCKKGFLKPQFIPDMKLVGIKFLAFNQFRFNPKNINFKCGLNLSSSDIFAISSGLEAFKISVFDSYDEYVMELGKFNRVMKDKLSQKPQIRLFSTDTLNLTFPLYERLVEDLFQIG